MVILEAKKHFSVIHSGLPELISLTNFFSVFSIHQSNSVIKVFHPLSRYFVVCRVWEEGCIGKIVPLPLLQLWVTSQLRW